MATDNRDHVDPSVPEDGAGPADDDAVSADPDSAHADSADIPMLSQSIPDPFPEPAASDDSSEPPTSIEPKPLPTYRPRAGGSVLMASMIGMANALGLEDHRDQIEIAIPFENDQDGLDFDFGHLPPL